MIFLVETDFNNKLDASVKAQIISGSADAFDLAELTAVATIQDSLSAIYDLDLEFAKQDNDRHKSLIQWCMNLAMYYLYERIPDDQLPPRVLKNYDDTIALLDKLESGKKTSTLTRLIDEETGTEKTTCRWGSDKRRTH